MLTLEGVETFYGPIAALKGVSFEVPAGEIVTVLGANGAGKSTIMRTISGLTPPARGTITFLGRRIDRTPPEAIVRLGISHVPEGRESFPDLTVRENLRIGAYTRKDSKEIAKDMDHVYEYFPRLKERTHQLGGTLSGGEQQMLAIGRGLMSSPKVLMLDEPSLGLMPKLVDEMLESVAKLKGEGKTILLVEQNVRESLELSDRGYVLQTGRTIHQGTGKELLNAEVIQKAFLGL